MAKSTSKDVAKLAGVSQSTVSMILNGKKDVSFSRETVDRVLNADKQLNYKSSLRQGGEKQNNGKAIAVFCANLDNPYYTMLIQTISNLSENYGYSMLVCDTHRKYSVEAGYIKFMNNMIAGAIYTYLPQYTDLFQKISNRVPVVVLGDKDETVTSDSVELNSTKCGKLIAQYLLSLGHKKIAYISTPISDQMLARKRRVEGVLQEYEQHGFPNGVIVRASTGNYNDRESPINEEYCAGYNLTQEILKEGDHGISAFVGLNDMVALGIMDALADGKYRIPQDYSVVGCDNNIFSRLASVSLTTVEHFVNQKGEDAFNMLINKIQHKYTSKPEILPQKIVRLEYEPKLIVRGTTGPNKRK